MGNETRCLFQSPLTPSVLRRKHCFRGLATRECLRKTPVFFAPRWRTEKQALFFPEQALLLQKQALFIFEQAVKKAEQAPVWHATLWFRSKQAVFYCKQAAFDRKQAMFYRKQAAFISEKRWFSEKQAWAKLEKSWRENEKRWLTDEPRATSIETRCLKGNARRAGNDQAWIRPKRRLQRGKQPGWRLTQGA